MPQPSVGRDVEDHLLGQWSCRRKPGEVPYPVEYCNGSADFDIWHHMFLTNYCGSLTIHKFSEPPSRTLDLGCGTGYWAIEAAKQWPHSTIVGFDYLDMQPKLEAFGHLGSIARRVKWVRGNMLDGLPFPPDHFDFIRVAGLGLAVPEDEWQTLFEDIFRILKPGGVLEIVEDDLIFPCSSAHLQPPKPSLPVPMFQLPPLDLSQRPSTSTSRSSDRKGSLLGLGRISLATSHSSVNDLSTSTKASSCNSTCYPSQQSSTTTLPAQTSPTVSDSDTTTDTEHPQDHTRLKLSWEAMLASRFLSDKLLSVLPFYFSSASFKDVKSHPHIMIPLPPNSGAVATTLKSYRSIGSIRRMDRLMAEMILDFPVLSNRSTKSDGFSVHSSLVPPPRPTGPAWSTMHLARTVNVITGCKEAIWAEYRNMFSQDALNVLSRTAPAEDISSIPFRHCVRLAFEVDWKNWECDMRDRQAMRSTLFPSLSWETPLPHPEFPDHQPWRERLVHKPGAKGGGHIVAEHDPGDLCRSFRAFTGRKGVS